MDDFVLLPDEPTPTELVAWSAGVLDGEGSFYTRTNGYAPIISCEMSDGDVITLLGRLYGGSVRMNAIRQEKWKQTWSWSISGDEAAKVMLDILPYMSGRRTEKIESVLEKWNTHKENKKARSESLNEAAKAYLDGKSSLRVLALAYETSYETIRQRAKKLQLSSVSGEQNTELN